MLGNVYVWVKETRREKDGSSMIQVHDEIIEENEVSAELFEKIFVRNDISEHLCLA